MLNFNVGETVFNSVIGSFAQSVYCAQECLWLLVDQYSSICLYNNQFLSAYSYSFIAFLNCIIQLVGNCSLVESNQTYVHTMHSHENRIIEKISHLLVNLHIEFSIRFINIPVTMLFACVCLRCQFKKFFQYTDGLLSGAPFWCFNARYVFSMMFFRVVHLPNNYCGSKTRDDRCGPAAKGARPLSETACSIHIVRRTKAVASEHGNSFKNEHTTERNRQPNPDRREVSNPQLYLSQLRPRINPLASSLDHNLFKKSIGAAA